MDRYSSKYIFCIDIEMKIQSDDDDDDVYI